MPRRRNADRESLPDDPTIPHDTQASSGPPDTDFEPTVALGPPTRRSTGWGSPDDPSQAADRFDDPTRFVGREAGTDDDQRTVVVRPPGGRGAAAAAGDASAVQRAMEDPPAGWLVVVDGPGMGLVGTIGIGQNSVGRDVRSNRVAFDNGDRMLSRTRHIVVVYDPANQKFYVQPGDGTNLAYIDNTPILGAQELTAEMELRLGRTVLRFVPLCGDTFQWPTE